MAKTKTVTKDDYLNPTLGNGTPAASGNAQLLEAAGAAQGAAAELSGKSEQVDLQTTAFAINKATEVGKAAYEGYVTADTFREITKITDYLYNPNLPQDKNATFVGPKIVQGVANDMGAYVRKTKTAVDAGVITAQEAMVRLAAKEKELIAAHPAEAHNIRRVFHEQTGISNFHSELVNTALRATPPKAGEDKEENARRDLDKSLAQNPEVQLAFYQQYGIGGSDVFTAIRSNPALRQVAASVAAVKTTDEIAQRVSNSTNRSNTEKARATGQAIIAKVDLARVGLQADLLRIPGFSDLPQNLTPSEFARVWSDNKARVNLLVNTTLGKLEGYRSNLVKTPQADAQQIAEIDRQIAHIKRLGSDDAQEALSAFRVYQSALQAGSAMAVNAATIMQTHMQAMGAKGNDYESYMNSKLKMQSDNPNIRAEGERTMANLKRNRPALYEGFEKITSDYNVNGASGKVYGAFRQTQQRLNNGDIKTPLVGEGGRAAFNITVDNTLTDVEMYAGGAIKTPPKKDTTNGFRAMLARASPIGPHADRIRSVFSGNPSPFDKMIETLPESEKQPYLDDLSKIMWGRVSATSDNTLMSSISSSIKQLEGNINRRLTGQKHTLGVGIDPDTQRIVVGAYTDEGFVPYNRVAAFKELSHDINVTDVQQNLDNLQQTVALSAQVINKADKTTTINDVKNHVISEFITNMGIEQMELMPSDATKYSGGSAGRKKRNADNPPEPPPVSVNPVSGKIKRAPNTTGGAPSDQATLGTPSPNRDEAGNPIRPVRNDAPLEKWWLQSGGK